LSYLFDTSAWLWSVSASERLSKAVRKLLETEAGRHTFYFSAASAWEIAIKAALGKLRLPAPASEFVPEILMQQGVRSLPVTSTHALAVADLPFHHTDPFDRLLIAQAEIEGLTVLTADKVFRPYSVRTLW
jgi:PIN domain nuclease of toxin-antitoxin system